MKLFLFEPTEESLKCSLYSKQNILKNLGMYFSEGLHSTLVRFQYLLLSYSGKSFAGPFIVVSPVQKTEHLEKDVWLIHPQH